MSKSALDNIHSLQFMHVVGTTGDKTPPPKKKTVITIVNLNYCCWRNSCGNLNTHMTSPPRARIKSTVNLIAIPLCRVLVLIYIDGFEHRNHDGDE